MLKYYSKGRNLVGCFTFQGESQTKKLLNMKA
jgi:hypothetical protein